jgi:hypothetical protein
MVYVMSEVKSLMFVFDRMPDQDGCTFIEVENAEGQSVCAGEWRDRDDGLVELVVPAPSLAAEEPVFYAQVSGVEKKEGWRGLIKAERDSTNGYTVSLYIRPDFDAQRLRADTAEADLKELEEAVVWALPGTRFMDPPDGGSPTLGEQVGRMAEALAAAEQRIAELTKSFEKFRDVVRGCERLASKYSPCIDAVDEGGGDDNDDPTLAIFHRLYYAMFDADAALNPNPEAESHE